MYLLVEVGKKDEFKYYITNTKHWTECRRGGDEYEGDRSEREGLQDGFENCCDIYLTTGTKNNEKEARAKRRLHTNKHCVNNGSK